MTQNFLCSKGVGIKAGNMYLFKSLKNNLDPTIILLIMFTAETSPWKYRKRKNIVSFMTALISIQSKFLIYF